MSANTNAFENKLIDFLFRGQALGLANSTAAAGTGPSQHYVCLFKAAGDDTGPVTEVTGGSYARVAVPATLAAWAGTQGAGTTVSSSGTSGTTSNNLAVTFPQPTVDWGTCVEWGIADSLAGGTVIIRAPLGASKTINADQQPPAFAPGALSYQVDN